MSIAVVEDKTGRARVYQHANLLGETGYRLIRKRASTRVQTMGATHDVDDPRDIVTLLLDPIRAVDVLSLVGETLTVRLEDGREVDVVFNDWNQLSQAGPIRRPVPPSGTP